ncbi:MAG: PatB family C-S lyase [Alistipes sp.]|nr:PatB family C-S lyase [Alistipes sp.]
MEKIYDFDKILDRSGSHSIKYDSLKELYGREDLIPLWVADMDFETPDFIIDALKQRLEHPVLGYTEAYDEYWQSIISWQKQRHNWDVERDWVRYIPGIVKGIGMAITCFTEPNDKIIIQTPVYHPFRLVPEHNGRRVVDNPMKISADGRCEMDFEQLESVIDSSCKMIILANPHNPIGVVWDKASLQRLADIAVKHNMIVISDEIHCDMPLYGNVHTPFAMASEAAAECSITFAAPSKTFNIAGIVSSYTVVKNQRLRDKFFAYLEANEMDMPTIFAMVATEAAFTHGEAWRQQMVRYVEQNVDFVADYIAEHIPAIKVVKPQASYLVWLDFSALGITHERMVDMVVNDARLAMNDGAMFGEEGKLHMRMNVGVPRSVLEKALEQLKAAVDNLNAQ